MWDKVKEYFVEVVLKKYGPSFIKGAVGWLIIYMGAHQGLLNALGITWDNQGHTIDIDLDTLSAWTLTVGSGALMALLTAIQHHTGTDVKPQPQGDTK